MSKLFLTVLLVVLMAGVWTTGLFGGDLSLGLKGGGATYFGDVKQNPIDPYGAISLDTWLSEKFAFQAYFSGAHIQAEENNYYFETRAWNIGAMAKYRPLGKSKVSPYLMAGFESLKFNPNDGNGNILPNNKANLYDLVQYSIPAGAGVSFFLKENFSLDLEGILHFASTDYLDDLKQADAKDVYLTASLGLVFHFGGTKDTDGDGIIDKLDSDPLRAEDFDGFQDEDGAPDLDNDQDGIPDFQDKAPMDPEDHDGFEDQDGVPDPDNDKDGILDVNDGAPNKPEDKDGYQDEDGVPDLDNDGDGILDKMDGCPNQAETMNGYEDSDGCPDKKPEVAVEKGKAIILKGVNFATSSARLTPESKAVLDKVVRTMQENPEIEVEIRGYTDNRGNYEYNVQLSQKRADAVKAYLVQNGIDAARIKTRGFGPENPVAPNDTREGRAKNRRIEFYRIK